MSVTALNKQHGKPLINGLNPEWRKRGITAVRRTNALRHSCHRFTTGCIRTRMPKTALKNAVPYEEWIAEADGDFEWKSFDENTAAGMKRAEHPVPHREATAEIFVEVGRVG